MKSAQLGKPTSPVEITNVSKHGFWLLIEGSERFLAFEKFPWFQDATISQVLNVELPSPHHLYWPGCPSNSSMVEQTQKSLSCRAFCRI